MQRRIQVLLDHAGYAVQYSVDFCDVGFDTTSVRVSPELPFATTPEQALALALEALPTWPQLPGFAL